MGHAGLWSVDVHDDQARVEALARHDVTLMPHQMTHKMAFMALCVPTTIQSDTDL